jgi:hypothetical protein
MASEVTTPEAGDEVPVVPPERDPKDVADANYKKLLSLTGIKDADVIGYNSSSRTIVTSAGGKYTLSKTGKKFRTVLGPLAPTETEAPSEDEE